MAVDGAMGSDVHVDPLIGRRVLAVVAFLLWAPGLVDVARASIPHMFAAPATPGRIPKAFTMESGSMIPTLAKGDVISAVSLTGAPRRGDVILFDVAGKDRPWVKRVIGLPGDTVQMKAGRLYLNGTVVQREPIAKVRTEDFYGAQTEVPTYRETLPGGVSYTIIEMQGDTGFNDNTELVKVPPERYFVMGDNRDNSTDSRVPVDQGGVGLVATKDLVGRADLIIGSMTRKDSTMMPIH